MEKILVALTVLFCGTLALTAAPTKSTNPFFQEFKTPFGVPPFEKIKVEHYMPAFRAGIDENQREVKAIAESTAPATFANTVEPLEKSGALLKRVTSVFFVLSESMTDEKMQAIATEVSPLLSKNSDDILLNERLFERIKRVYENREKESLTPEQKRLTEIYYKRFLRNGAALPQEMKDRLRKINEELGLLELKFSDNVLAENNAFQMVLDKREELAGLPEGVVSGAAEAAQERGLTGKWVFTLHKPSLLPFLTYSDRRDLREKLYRGYFEKGNNNDSLDNKAILVKITNLRIDKAHILGFPSFADYSLTENMAQNPDKVYTFLGQIWEPARRKALQEAAEWEALGKKDDPSFKLQPWDWWYYAEKVRKAKYDLDEESLRPYFKLENVLQGAFDVAGKLYGLKFVERKDIPKYHKDVRVFEVLEKDGRHVGIFYTDYFPRASKRGGAWMNSFRDESIVGGKRIAPVVSNNGNFSKPTGDKPALLSFEEVTTLFHEFGHALHGLLMNVTYSTVGGAGMPIDFIELPSQIMENWASEPEVLKSYAKHYQTGEVMPDSLIAKMSNAKRFNQGFETVEYLAASILDMDWHRLQTPFEGSPLEFEKRSMERIGLMPEILPRYRSTYYLHIFGGGYSAGYYSYIWAQVLDADAFQAFKETSLFDSEAAARFRKFILERSGTDEAMKLYKEFRGAEPKVDALLKRKGLD
ncbi:MAG TPA: M3 family metallopeptidase [Candidatus Aminicenantes bacterium]|nr:M3 family metallopeptidase [Candidatus Aminicenantes bacterium]